MRLLDNAKEYIYLIIITPWGGALRDDTKNGCVAD